MEEASIPFGTMWKHIESLPNRFDVIEEKNQILKIYIESKKLQLEKESC